MPTTGFRVPGARIAGTVLAISLGLALAGCPATKPNPASGGTRTGGGAGAEKRVGGGPGTARSETPTTAAVIETTVQEETGFLTPSRNIGCYLGADYVRCDIIEKYWTPPPRPDSCPPDYGDFGHGLAVGNGTAGPICAGDTVFDTNARILEYGHALRLGQFVCVSLQAYVRCQNDTTHHGFTLARENYTTF